MSEYQSIGVIGGGAWGTALAETAAKAGRDVTLWCVEPEVSASINSDHENAVFLPGVTLSESIRATNDIADLAGCDAILAGRSGRHQPPRG